MSSSLVSNVAPADSQESWWEKANTIDKLAANSLPDPLLPARPKETSFSESLENILARSDSIVNNEGLNIAQAAPTTVTGEAVTFEELINSENEQIREFAVLDQQPLSPDWICVKNANPVTPSNFKAITGLSDGLMLSQRFANAIYSQ